MRDEMLSLEAVASMTFDELVEYYRSPAGQRELQYYPRLAEYSVEEAVAEMLVSLNITPKQPGGGEV